MQFNKILEIKKIMELRVKGFFDKSPELKLDPMTKEQRTFIAENFPNHNAFARYGGQEERYVLTHNVHSHCGRGMIAFRNEGGILKASVAFFENEESVMKPRCRPIAHFDVEKVDIQSARQLKEKLSDTSAKKSHTL